MNRYIVLVIMLLSASIVVGGRLMWKDCCEKQKRIGSTVLQALACISLL